MSIPFLIVGATARDILLEVHYGIGSKRATVDIDIAVFIENWDLFKRLKDELIGINDFNLERLFEEAPDIVESSDYDYEVGSARLLGWDISKIAYTSTMSKLIGILK